MRERQQRQIAALERIARFLRQTVFTNPRLLHVKDEFLATLARVMELVSENYEAKSKSHFGRRRPRFTKAVLRERHLLPLSRRGRKLARECPELLPALKVPHKNASAAEIADAAERMADALTPHLDVLIEARYPRNYLKTLRQDAQALREQTDTVRVSRGLVGRSNRKLAQELAVARDTIEELDSLLRSLDDYSKYRADWEICNRVGPRQGRPSKRRLEARARSAARSRKRDEEGPNASPA